MRRHLPLILAVGLLLAFRVLGSLMPNTLPNFQPLAAVFFCGALLATGWRGFALPLGIWAITYPLGVGHTGSLSLFATTLAAFALIFFLGKSLSQKGFVTMLLGSLAGAALFHLMTCGVAWIADPRYAKTMTGLWQSLWLGAPGDVMPSWVFLRNLTAANFLFTGVFLAARMRMPKITETSSSQSLA